jgi:membrane protease YdiL (CAAX protease family)
VQQKNKPEVNLKQHFIEKQTNYLIFVVVLIYLVFQLLFQVLFGKLWIDNNLYILLAFFQLVVILLPALVFMHLTRPYGTAVLKLKRITILEGLLVIMMTVASSLVASVLNSFVIFLLEKIGPVTADNVPAPRSIPELWIQVFVIVLLPAICEEIFFRGVVLGAFESLGIRTAIIISAFYFTLFHFDIRNLLGPFFLGILFAWFCYRTGSIIAGILAHFTNNLLAVLINWYNRHIPVGSVTLTPAIMGELIILASVVGFILAIMLKAFGTITKGKVKPAPDSKKASVIPVITHWPMLAVYSAYLIITVLFLISLTRPIL